MVTVLSVLTQWTSHAHAIDRCPVCQEPAVDVTTQVDDRSKPSKNIAVWNRSMCGNKFFEAGSTICLKDGYAYEAKIKRWQLWLADRESFKHPLDLRIYAFPLLNKNQRAVYSQEFVTLGSITHGLAFRTINDKAYLAKIRQYAKTQNVHLNIEPDKEGGEVFIMASITSKSGQGAAVQPPPAPARK